MVDLINLRVAVKYCIIQLTNKMVGLAKEPERKCEVRIGLTGEAHPQPTILHKGGALC